MFPNFWQKNPDSRINNLENFENFNAEILEELKELKWEMEMNNNPTQLKNTLKIEKAPAAEAPSEAAPEKYKL